MLDYYRIEQKIVEGTTCWIYKAIRLINGTPAIIKKHTDKKRYDKEIAITNALNHVNISKIITHGVYKSERYILMPHYGRSITKLMKSRIFSRKNIKYYMKQILEALEHMHSKGIIHADLSTSNVLISRQTHKLTIIDFESAHSDTRPIKLQTHIFYRAPEQNIFSKKVDIWSAGCIFAAMMLRRHLFQHSSIINWDLFIGWPEERAILVKMLEPDPSIRTSAKILLDLPYFT
jgi:serine/threonine protein kinase